MADYSKTRFEYKDDFEWIRVIDIFPQQHRYLHFETSIQGVMSLVDHTVPVLEYIGVMSHGARNLCNKPEKIILGGLGSCSLLNVLGAVWNKGTQFLTIEANERVFEIARRFFRLSPNDRVLLGDLREELESRRIGEQDLIMVDCYSAVSIPPHLTTLEFMFLLKKKLRPDGFAVFNLWSPSCNRICAHQIRTILEVFGEVAIIMCREDENVVLFAHNNQWSDWPSALMFKGLEYPILPISRRDKTTWPEFLWEGNLIEDSNTGEIFEATGYDF